MPTLIFDGGCGFCSTCARAIERRARVPVVVVPWQRVDLGALGLDAADVAAAAWWVEADGTKYRGHRAVGRALLSCRRPWPLAGRLCLLPPSSYAASLAYRLVARYRHRLPGGTPECRVGAPRAGR